MEPTAAVMILAFALIIGVTAVSLLIIAFNLKAVKNILGTIYVGCQVISYQTSTVPAAVASVNNDLRPVREFCENV